MPKDKQALTVSLIIPAYNEENYLERCLQSVANQTEMPDEVIIVNNNSTDTTLEIAQRFPFVRIINESQQGIVFARNAGFNAAQYDIIARIDADTELPNGWIHYIKRFYQNSINDTAAISGGGYFYNLRAQRLNGWLQSQLAFRMNRLIIGHFILWGSNMAFTREQWLAVRNKTSLRDDIHEDMDLAIQLHRHGYKIVYRPGLRVGVAMKRVYSNRPQLRGHMSRWPRTLRFHNYRLWWVGTLGNIFLWWIGQPVFYIIEYANRYLFRRKPLDD